MDHQGRDARGIGCVRVNLLELVEAPSSHFRH
jgi:hypothetical protein